MRAERFLDTLYGPAEDNDLRGKASARPAILLPVVDAFRRHKAHQREDRLLAGSRWQENGYVFPRHQVRHAPEG